MSKMSRKAKCGVHVRYLRTNPIMFYTLHSVKTLKDYKVMKRDWQRLDRQARRHRNYFKSMQYKREN